MMPLVERRPVSGRNKTFFPHVPASQRLPLAVAVSVVFHLLTAALLPRVIFTGAPLGLIAACPERVTVALQPRPVVSPKKSAASRPAFSPKSLPRQKRIVASAPQPRRSTLPRPALIRSPQTFAASLPVPAPQPAPAPPVVMSAHADSPLPIGPVEGDPGILMQERASQAPPATPSPAPLSLSALPGERPQGESRFAATEESGATETETPDAAQNKEQTPVSAKEKIAGAVVSADGEGLATRGMPFRAALDSSAPNAAPQATSRSIPSASAVSAGAPLCVVYVIDISGSMADAGKMDAVRVALAAALDELDAKDTFGIVGFSNEARWLTPAAQMATPENRRESRTRLDTVSLGGSTNLAGGLDLALKTPNVTHVFVLSDGVPSDGAVSRRELLDFIREANKNHAHIIPIALDADDEPEGIDLLQAIAAENQGWFKAVKVRRVTKAPLIP